MEKSSLDYREKLYSQIQEEYGKLVYTYTCHFKMADRLSNKKRSKTIVFFHSLHSSRSSFYYYYCNTLK